MQWRTVQRVPSPLRLHPVIPCSTEYWHCIYKQHRFKWPQVSFTVYMQQAWVRLHWNHWFPCARISTGRGRFYQILQHFLSSHFKKSADISYRIVLLRLENPMPTHVINTFSPPMCSSSGVFVSILNMIWKKLLRCRRNSILRERKQESLRNKTEGSLAECTNADSSNVDSEYNMKILPSTKKQAHRLQILFWLVL